MLEENKKRLRIFIIFAFFWFVFLCGTQMGSFILHAESYLIQPSFGQILKMIALGLSGAGSFSAVCTFLWSVFAGKRSKDGSEMKQAGAGKTVFCSTLVFLILWAFLFAMYLICYFSYYPGAYAYDIHWQTAQATGLYPYNTHHPPFHTWIWSLCIRAASGDIKNALSIYGIGQALLLSFALARMIHVIAKLCEKKWVLIVSVLFVCMNPVFAVFSFIMTKDVLFGVFLCLFMTSLYRNLKSPEDIGGVKKVLTATELLFCCLLRNNAIPAFVVFCIVLMLGKKRRTRENVWLFLLPVLCSVIISGPVFQLLKIERGDIAEMFHVPMVQMSYTALEEWDSLTPRLREKFTAFLDIDEMRENFDPYFADVTKDHFTLNRYMGKENFVHFCLLYMELLIKYPNDYLYSWLHLTMPYWNPATKVDLRYHHADFISTDIVLKPDLIRESKFPVMYDFYERIAKDMKLRERWELCVLFSLSLPFWILMAAMTILWIGRRYDEMLFYLPFLLLWLTYVLGPIALGRYMLPFMLCYPLMLAAVFGSQKQPQVNS